MPVFFISAVFLQKLAHLEPAYHKKLVAELDLIQ